MSGTLQRFISILERMGSDVTFHREGVGVDCPCRTPEGFRDPIWHIDNIEGVSNPTLPVGWGGINPAACNEEGKQRVAVFEMIVKASIQPSSMMGGTRRSPERLSDLLGVIQRDDHVGIFPCRWLGQTLDFNDWGLAGEDFIVYDGRRFNVVAVDKVPDIDGNPNHHYEVGLRLMKNERSNG